MEEEREGITHVHISVCTNAFFPEPKMKTYQHSKNQYLTGQKSWACNFENLYNNIIIELFVAECGTFQEFLGYMLLNDRWNLTTNIPSCKLFNPFLNQ